MKKLKFKFTVSMLLIISAVVFIIFSLGIPGSGDWVSYKAFSITAPEKSNYHPTIIPMLGILNDPDLAVLHRGTNNTFDFNRNIYYRKILNNKENKSNLILQLDSDKNVILNACRVEDSIGLVYVEFSNDLNTDPLGFNPISVRFYTYDLKTGANAKIPLLSDHYTLVKGPWVSAKLGYVINPSAFYIAVQIFETSGNSDYKYGYIELFKIFKIAQGSIENEADINELGTLTCEDHLHGALFSIIDYENDIIKILWFNGDLDLSFYKEITKDQFQYGDYDYQFVVNESSNIAEFGMLGPILIGYEKSVYYRFGWPALKGYSQEGLMKYTFIEKDIEMEDIHLSPDGSFLAWKNKKTKQINFSKINFEFQDKQVSHSIEDTGYYDGIISVECNWPMKDDEKKYGLLASNLIKNTASYYVISKYKELVPKLSKPKPPKVPKVPKIPKKW